jgi:hypothetical protein
MGRICAECNRDLPQTLYTANQWSKGSGYSRCAGCVHGHHSDDAFALQSNSGRYNDSDHATFPNNALLNPFASVPSAGSPRDIMSEVHATAKSV